MLNPNPNPCAISRELGADKICINQSCQFSNPYVCSTCFSSHEHDGCIMVVMVSRLDDICSKVGKYKEDAALAIDKLEQVKKSINGRIDMVVRQCRDNEKILNELDRQLQEFNVNPMDKKLAATWHKIVNNRHVLSHDCNKLLANCVSDIKNQLENLCSGCVKLQPNSENINNCCNEVQQNEQANQSSSFVEQFASIFTYLPLELKNKSNDNICQQLGTLVANSRSQKKILVRLFEVVGQLEKSLQIYDSMEGKNCLDVEIISKKALLLKKLKKYQQAYDQLTMVIWLLQGKASPEIYHFHRGDVCKELGRFDEAISQYNKCVGKQSVKSYNLDKAIAQVYLKQGNYKQAIPLLKKSLQHNTITSQTKLQIYQNLYECSKLSDDHILAVESLTHLHELHPQNLDYLFKRAREYHQLKNYDKAIIDYSTAIEKVTTIPGLYYNRAVQYIFSGKKQQSISDLKKAIQMDPNFKQATHLLANTAYELMQKNDNKSEIENLRNLAINCYGTCLKFYQTNPNIWYNVGVLESDQNPQNAYQCFVKTIKLSPKLTAAYTGKIKMSLKLNINHKDILNDINTAIQLGQRSQSIFLIKCNIEEELGLYDQAIDTAELILKSDPENLNLGRLVERVRMKGKRVESRENNTAVCNTMSC